MQVLSIAVHNHYQRILNTDQLMAARKEKEEAGKPEELKTGGRGLDADNGTSASQQPAAVPYPVSEETRRLMEDRTAFVRRSFSEIESRCGLGLESLSRPFNVPC